ncbi:FAD-dependent oxidoreductase [Mycolicibacterium sp. S2-37]|nr:FAD-dependent oxidoreductase [Mycolicibacterium sp. S2-37]
MVGAGFTGLEIATELVGRLRDMAAGQEVRVIFLERAEALGPELRDEPRPVIVDALDTLGVERRLGRTVASATETQVTLDDGEVIPAATLIGPSACPPAR